MPRIAEKRRCVICKKWMEVGEKFILKSFRFQGVDRMLPIHPKHSKSYQENTEKLNSLKAQLAQDESNYTGGKDIVTDSLINELTAEIQRSEKWGQSSITHDRLNSLIRKYSVTTPGDISTQPGQWQIRGGYVDAIQHDGTETGAQKVRQWIFDRNGESRIVRDDDVDISYLKLDTPREPSLVQKNWWVVKTADGIFYTMPDNDFHTIYVPRQEGHD